MSAADRDPIVQKVIDAVGGAELARRLKLNRQAVYQWDRIPPQHVIRVEEITGVSRHKQRPDLYPEEPLPKAEAAE